MVAGAAAGRGCVGDQELDRHPPKALPEVARVPPGWPLNGGSFLTENEFSNSGGMQALSIHSASVH